MDARRGSRVENTSSDGYRRLNCLAAAVVVPYCSNLHILIVSELNLILLLTGYHAITCVMAIVFATIFIWKSIVNKKKQRIFLTCISSNIQKNGRVQMNCTSHKNYNYSFLMCLILRTVY